VAIPVYNGARSLHRALDSALAQDTDTPFEIVVSNNGSKDATRQILEQYADPRLKITHFEDTVNMWENHNRCLELTQARYVVFCHADDRLETNALRLFERRLREREWPERYVAWGRSLFRDFLPNWEAGGGVLDQPLVGEYAFLPFSLGGVTPSGTVFSTASLRESGGFYPCTLRVSLSDMATELRLALNGFTIEMTSFCAFERREATTLTQTDSHASRDALWDALDALHAEFGTEALVLAARKGRDRLHFDRLSALEHYLLERHSAFSARDIAVLLARRNSPRLWTSGDGTRLARTLARQATAQLPALRERLSVLK
jgi:glycosyltransferase involved in cell wall biosynthesis